MTKPWEETWASMYEASGGYDCMVSAYVVRQEGARLGRVVDVDCPDLEPDAKSEAIGKLLAAAPEMARLLLAAHRNDSQCFSCHHLDNDIPNHADDCEVVAVLRKAGIR